MVDAPDICEGAYGPRSTEVEVKVAGLRGGKGYDRGVWQMSVAKMAKNYSHTQLANDTFGLQVPAPVFRVQRWFLPALSSVYPRS